MPHRIPGGAGVARAAEADAAARGTRALVPLAPWGDDDTAMKPMTLREVADLGHLLGHSGTEITQTASGARWTVGCSCGYLAATRRTQADALDAIVRHLLKTIAAHGASGRPLPDIPLPGARRDTQAEVADKQVPRAVRSAS